MMIDKALGGDPTVGGLQGTPATSMSDATTPSAARERAPSAHAAAGPRTACCPRRRRSRPRRCSTPPRRPRPRTMLSRAPVGGSSGHTPDRVPLRPRACRENVESLLRRWSGRWACGFGCWVVSAPATRVARRSTSAPPSARRCWPRSRSRRAPPCRRGAWSSWCGRTARPEPCSRTSPGCARDSAPRPCQNGHRVPPRPARRRGRRDPVPGSDRPGRHRRRARGVDRPPALAGVEAPGLTAVEADLAARVETDAASAVGPLTELTARYPVPGRVAGAADDGSICPDAPLSAARSSR